MNLTLIQLQGIMPRMGRNPKTAATLLPHLNAAMAGAQINTVGRVAAFLAQVAHESCEFRYMEEIASGAAYEGRADLGNTEPGDGVRYKGRGFLQLTGRDNYRACGAALGVDLEGDPGLAATPEYAFKTSCWFWTKHNLNELADKGEFELITRRINGGLNGYEQRLGYLHAALTVLQQAG